MFKPLTLIAAGLSLMIATAAPALDLDAMTQADRAAFRAEVRAYLLENPEVLMEAIGVLEQRQQAAELQNDVALVRANADALFNDGYSFVGGNPDGDITMVEFLDYRCGYCRRAFEDVATLLNQDGNIRFVVKEYPILGEQSVMASQFAISVQKIYGDAAYKDIHDALMTLRSDVTPVSLGELAAAFDLDMSAILDKMLSQDVARIISENALLGQRMRITGTPTFIVDDQMLRGYVPLDQMQGIVAQIREAG